MPNLQNEKYYIIFYFCIPSPLQNIWSVRVGPWYRQVGQMSRAWIMSRLFAQLFCSIGRGSNGEKGPS